MLEKNAQLGGDRRFSRFETSQECLPLIVRQTQDSVEQLIQMPQALLICLTCEVPAVCIMPTSLAPTFSRRAGYGDRELISGALALSVRSSPPNALWSVVLAVAPRPARCRCRRIRRCPRLADDAMRGQSPIAGPERSDDFGRVQARDDPDDV